jgi:thioredoxin 1
MLSPFIDELSKKYKNISFFKIDIDKLNDVANQYQISSIPTILIFKNTKLINTLVGFNSKEKINSILNKIK